MIICDFHLLCIAVAPDEANPPLIIHPDAVPANPVTFESLQPISGRGKHIPQKPRPVQIFQLAPGRILNIWRQFAGTFATEDPLRLLARKTSNHIGDSIASR